MRKLSIAAALAAAVTLGGCATNGGGGASVASIQQAAVAACGFLPTAATVAAILAKNNARILDLIGTANAICAAVVPAPHAGRMARIGAVDGVVVHGRFVR